MADFHSAFDAAVQYAQANPIRVSGFAIQAGCLHVLGPGGVAALPLKIIGFGGAGPISGSLAAWWQSASYGAYIPPGSVFSAFQAIGMHADWMGIVMPSAGTLLAMIPGYSGLGAVTKWWQ